MHLPSNLPAITLPTPAPTSPLSSAPSFGSSAIGNQSIGGSSFSDILSGAINEVEGARADANQSVANFLSGNGDDLHSTILSSQRADLEFQMFMQVRNKVVSAYQEIMKMQM
jgi:flagellar hook-basal body complex protein FliE